jgi:D-alanyl-D-alanine carboxypeptidase
MFRVRIRLSTGVRSAIWILAATMVSITASDPAAAKRHHRHGPAAANTSYNPPFASIVVDANSGKVLQDSNADGLRHPASLTKIMTLYLLFERLEAGKLKLDSPLKVSEHAASQAPSKLGLDAGDTIDVEDAIRAVVTKSANDVAVVIAEAVGGDENEFAKLMTAKAHALGMTHTEYRNASGLPDDNQITTARDLALLGRAIQDRFPRYYRYFATPSFTYRGNSMRNHNHLLGSLEGVDGIKTGYTDASGFNLVTSMKRGNRYVVAVVLGGRSAGQRDSRMRELLTQNITHAADRRTAPVIAEKPQGFAVASTTASTAPKPEAATTSAVRPAPGSSDPIKPILVRTIPVKAGATRSTASEPPTLQAPTSQPAEAPKPQIIAVKPDPDPAPIINPQPGVLGVLPAQVAAQTIQPVTAPPVTVQPSAANVTIGPPPAPTLQTTARQQNVIPVPAQVATASPAPSAGAIARDVAPTTTAKAEPAPPPTPVHTGWIVQVGALEAESEAKARLDLVRSKTRDLLARAESFTEPVSKGEKTLYRARFAGLDKDRAEAVCKSLKRSDIPCMALKN